MIDNLLNYGINKNTIDKIKELDFLEYEFNINYNNCIIIINYLREIGIIKIDELLIYIPDLFFKPKKIVEDLFNRDDKMELISRINEDYFNIDLLFE